MGSNPAREMAGPTWEPHAVLTHSITPDRLRLAQNMLASHQHCPRPSPSAVFLSPWPKGQRRYNCSPGPWPCPAPPPNLSGLVFILLPLLTVCQVHCLPRLKHQACSVLRGLHRSSLCLQLCSPCRLHGWHSLPLGIQMPPSDGAPSAQHCWQLITPLPRAQLPSSFPDSFFRRMPMFARPPILFLRGYWPPLLSSHRNSIKADAFPGVFNVESPSSL